MALSLGGSKSKSKSTTNQTQTDTMSDRAVGAINSQIGQVQGQSYEGLDPAAVSKWMNPYQREVTDATMGQLDHDREIARNSQKADFARAGAFGDTRRGVYEAELDGNLDRNSASVLAGLNSANYGQALETAQTDNQGANQYSQNQQSLINQLVAMFGNEGTKTMNGKSSGTQMGVTAGWASK